MSTPPPAEQQTRLSPSVQSVLRKVGPGSMVTPFDLAKQLCTIHPEYGHQRAGHLLTTIDAAGRSALALRADDWMQYVLSVFEPGKTPEMHGRLVLIGLGLLYRPLREYFGEREFWGALAEELRPPYQALLSPWGTKLESGALSAATPAIERVAGYVSDSVPDSAAQLTDELEVAGDVSTLCSVLLATQVHPPLAVGLFGDWGTGKSYFMQQMYYRIEDLSKRSAAAEKTAYHSQVIQIRFNAWHYVDANLWASLVSHIFDELAVKLCPKESAEETRKRLVKELESARQIRAAAEDERQRATSQKDAAAFALEDAVEQRKKKEITLAALRPPDLLRLLNSEPQLQEQLRAALSQMGLPEAIGSVEELESVYKQAFTLRGRLQAALSSMSRDGKPARMALAAVLGAIVLIGILASVVGQGPLAGIHAVIADFVVAVSGFVVTAKKYLGKASDCLNVLETRRAAVLKVLHAQQEMVSQKEVKLQQDLQALRTEEEAARRRVSEAEERLRDIQQRIDDIDSGRNLSKFILERVGADDYRKHLGIISIIRKDFERLSGLLRDGKGGMGQVGRIILYIDDLDRCPAGKVVEVLQAVHLLLAMPLFVAVVGVDLRWLLHSLKKEMSAFDAVDREAIEWATSPLNYLEKIFQIPFHLRPMGKDGYGRLMQSLFPAEAAETQQEGAPDEEQGEQKLGVRLAAKTVAIRPVDLDPASLRIQKWERGFAETLFPFISTPRAAKRFSNLYRLIKAPLQGEELKRFEGTEAQPGAFRAAMFLLALSSGQSGKLAAALQSAFREKSWEAFPDEMALSPEQVATYDKLPIQTMDGDLRKWERVVARYSFGGGKTQLEGDPLPLGRKANAGS